MNHEYDKIKDFKIDEVKATDWIERRHEYWRTQLRPHERKLITDYVHEHDMFKEILKEYGGNKDIIDNTKYPGIKDKLDEIDRLLKHDVNKLRYKKDIYITYSPKDLGLPAHVSLSDPQSPTSIERNRAENLLKKFKYGNLADLETGNLTKDIGQDTMISLRVTMPEGTHLGYFYDESVSKVIIPANCSVKINSMKIAVHNGKETLFFKGELKERKYLDEKINSVREKLMEKFIEFNKPQDFIKFDIGRGLESYTLNFAEESIKSLVENFPKNIYEYCISDHLNQIIFTDDKILGEEFLAGEYNSGTKILYIRPTTATFLLNRDKSTDSKTAILHEAAHMADSAVVGAGYDSTFANYFINESPQLTDALTYNNYGRENPREFMAEVFKCMYSPYSAQRREIREAAPKAVEFIEREIDSFIL